MKSVEHLRIISFQDDWETPIELYLKACQEYKIFPQIDVCASKNNTKCHYFLDKKDNGLKYAWYQDFFMNPPYSEIDEWMKKAWEDHELWNNNALILTYSKTDTKWWHNYVEKKAEVHNIKGRIKFFMNGIKSQNSAPYPSCWIIYRKKDKKRIFSDWEAD